MNFDLALLEYYEKIKSENNLSKEEEKELDRYFDHLVKGGSNVVDVINKMSKDENSIMGIYNLIMNKNQEIKK